MKNKTFKKIIFSLMLPFALVVTPIMNLVANDSLKDDMNKTINTFWEW